MTSEAAQIRRDKVTSLTQKTCVELKHQVPERSPFLLNTISAALSKFRAYCFLFLRKLDGPLDSSLKGRLKD